MQGSWFGVLSFDTCPSGKYTFVDCPVDPEVCMDETANTCMSDVI